MDASHGRHDAHGKPPYKIIRSHPGIKDADPVASLDKHAEALTQLYGSEHTPKGCGTGVEGILGLISECQNLSRLGMGAVSANSRI
jgi:hypothetical protein